MTHSDGAGPGINVAFSKAIRSTNGPESSKSAVEVWQSDSSYMRLASKGAVLSAEAIPPKGGQTEWADMRAAYDALGGDMKDRIADLSAYHSLFYSQAQIGHQVEVGAGYGFDDRDPPLRPLVKIHPVPQ